MSDDALNPRTSLQLAGVVHDVNQMLSVISGRAGLLLSQDTDPRWKPHLEAMLLASSDAAAIMRRLSDTTADGPERGGANLRATAEQARLLVWPTDNEAFDWRDDIPAHWDTRVPDQILREVLANLLLNALAVMPAGGRINLTGTAGPAGSFILRVSDTGPGLPPGDPEQVFARGFSRSGETGRGLGLAGCRQLLATWGAAITATNDAETGGASLVLTLPGGASKSQVRPSSGDVPAMTVLVVDDEPVVREMLADVLGAWGCTVECHGDGRAALDARVAEGFAVALIDRNLPGLDGLELATLLRESDPCASIVLMTGWQQRASLPPAATEVVDREVEKPLAIETLREIMIAGHRMYEVRRNT